MHPDVAAKRDSVGRLCREFGVRRLDVFGSAARGDDFDPGRSDVDLLVQFGPQGQEASWGAYFDLRERLAQLLGRPVDLVEEGTIRNPYLQAAIERDRRTLYAA